MKPIFVLVALSLACSGVWAQDAARPLNLKLPPDYVPAPATTAAAPRAEGRDDVAVNPAHPKDPPGTYYGDTSGRMPEEDVADDEPRCDDATYNKPQMHGSVSTGVMSGSHGRSGDYQSGVVNLSQAFGSCDHPTGGVSISVGGGAGHFNPGRR